MEQLEQTAESTETEDFSERVISKTTKRRRLRAITNDSSEGKLDYPYFYYRCTNCESYRILEEYTQERIERTPDPTIFGKRAKPTTRIRKTPTRYFCKSCGAENEHLDKIAERVYEEGFA